jgi:hypothetical protein
MESARGERRLPSGGVAEQKARSLVRCRCMRMGSVPVSSPQEPSPSSVFYFKFPWCRFGSVGQIAWLLAEFDGNEEEDDFNYRRVHVVYASIVSLHSRGHE